MASLDPARGLAHAKELHRVSLEGLPAGHYDIRLEYYDNEGPAGVRLLWSAPGLVREVIPASRLRP